MNGPPEEQPVSGRGDGVTLDASWNPGAHFEAILGALGEAVFVVRPSDRRIVMSNAAAGRLFGRDPGELVGQTTRVLYASEEDFRHFGVLSEADLRKGRPHRGFCHFRQAGGQVFEAAVTVTALDGRNWEAGVVSVLRDVTDERRFHDERSRMVERRNAIERLGAIAELAGGVAHDINNLLLPILVNVELGLPGASDELREQLEEIREAALRGRDLTRKLLTFARRQPAEKREVDVAAVVRNSEPILRSMTPHSATLEMAVGDEVLPVVGDPVLIEQLLVTLCANARDAVGEGGRIAVSTEAREVRDAGHYGRTGVNGRFVYLHVEDDGPGIPMDLLDKIFEPFFTTKSGTRISTGLGLSSALGIVEQHGGHIEIDTDEGVGTRISVGLPWAPAAPGGRAAATMDEVDRTAGEGKTVLVVEDDEAVRRVTARALESFGYTVLEASDAPSGLETLESMESPPDILVTDVVMPGMSGLELRAAIRESLPQLPVVFVSGYSWSALAAEGVAPDSIDILQKPFSPTELASAVQAALQTGGAQ